MIAGEGLPGSFYYAAEVKRRRLLAAKRRKIVRRFTDAPMPKPADILKAWNERKTFRGAVFRLGARHISDRHEK